MTVNGNVGVAGASSLTISTSSQVNGNVLVNSGASFHDGKSPSQNISGSVLTGQNLSAAVTDAENAFATYTALAPTQSLSGVSSPTIITGNGGTNVIDVNGNITNSITFKGSASDLFVLNVNGNINLTGTESILAGSGISPNQIVIDLEGVHQFNEADFNTVDGTVIAPAASGDLGGTINGRVFFGGSSLELMCGGCIKQPPAVPPPADALVRPGGSWAAWSAVRVLGKQRRPVGA